MTSSNHSPAPQSYHDYHGQRRHRKSRYTPPTDPNVLVSTIPILTSSEVSESIADNLGLALVGSGSLMCLSTLILSSLSFSFPCALIGVICDPSLNPESNSHSSVILPNLILPLPRAYCALSQSAFRSGYGWSATSFPIVEGDHSADGFLCLNNIGRGVVSAGEAYARVGGVRLAAGGVVGAEADRRADRGEVMDVRRVME